MSSPFTPDQLQAYKNQLEAQLKDLEDLGEGAHERQAVVELDQQSIGRLSRMDALQRQALHQETERRRSQTIQRIRLALQRFEEGDFGYCVNCDEPIAKKRLDLDASLPSCISCASKGS